MKIKKNKILVLSPRLSAISGVSTHVKMILESSLTNDFEFIHFEIGSEGKKENSFCKYLRITTDPIKFFFNILKSKPNLIHINSSVDLKAVVRDSIFIFISKLLGLKIITQIHGGILPSELSKSSFLGKCFFYFFRMSDLIIVLNSVELSEYKKYFPLITIELIPNAIPFVEDLDDSSLVEKRDFLSLIYIGRFIKNKGVFDIVDSLKDLNEKNVNFKFYFVGSGEADEELRKKVSDYNFGDKVSFLGNVMGKDKFKLLKQSDLFIFPTYHSEGMPYSILEAMASGVPTITCNIPGTKNLIKNNKNGCFVAPKNSKQLSKIILNLLNDYEKLEAMKQNCKIMFKEKYTIESLSRNLASVYRSVLN